MEQGNTTTTSNWLFATDESGSRQTPFAGFGALILPWERRGDLVGKIDELRLAHGWDHELKWNRVNERTLPLVLDVIDWFFRTRWLAFHCMVTRKADINKAVSDGDYDLAWRKGYTTFISDKCALSALRRPDRFHTVRVWTDPIASGYSKADEAAEVIGSRILRKRVGDRCRLKYVMTRDSKDTPTIQLCDLLLGAVVTSWLDKGQGQFKAEAREWIARQLGWPDLRGATAAGQPKFNIWYYWRPGSGPRQVWARRVRLLHPIEDRPIENKLVATTVVGGAP